MKIDSFEDERLDVFARLTEAQLRCRLEPEKGIFIAESFKVIDRALEAAMMPLAFLVTPRWLDETVVRAQGAVDRGLVEGDVPIFVAPLEVLKDLTGFNLTRCV